MKKQLLSTIFGTALIALPLFSIAQCPTSSTPFDDCSFGDNIEIFILDNIPATGNSGCGTNGYNNFTIQNWNLRQGSTYNWSAEVGYDSGEPFYPQSFHIWIDLNGDGQFEASERVATSPGNTVHTGTLTIPSTTLPVNGVKMRIRAAYDILGENTLTADRACEDFPNFLGEVEDYTVNILCPILEVPNGSENYPFCEGQEATVSLTAPNGTITWYSSNTSTTPLGTGSSFNAGVLTETTSFYAAAETPGCSSLRGFTQAVFNAAPAINIATPEPTCAEPITLDAGNAGNTYLWSSGETTQSITVNASGNYSVTVTNSVGCNDSETVPVLINPIPVITIGNQTICSGATANLSPTVNVPGGQWLWSPNGATSSSIAVSPTNNSIYTVNYTANECSAEPVSVSVTVSPLPTVNLGDDITGVVGPIVLNAQNPSSSYLWSTGATTQEISVSQNGTYSVTVTNAAGCSASDEISVNFTIGLNENGNILFSAHPNPVLNSVKIQVEEQLLNEKFELVDMAGKLISEGKINSTSFEINMDNLHTGTYLLRIRGVVLMLQKQ